jgi:hypothetical protein
MVGLARLMLVIWLAASLAACNRAQARVLPVTALNVPAPPVRVAIPVTLPEPDEPPTPEPLPPAEPPAAPARPRPDSGPGRGGERPATPPAPAPVEAAAAPVLQTTINIGVLEQKASGLLTEAKRNLDRVNRSELGPQGREQYDRAMGFIKGAHNALQVRNFMYAEQLAAKAATVARDLVKG